MPAPFGVNDLRWQRRVCAVIDPIELFPKVATVMQSLVAPMLAALALAALPAHAEQRNFTGPNGSYQGNAYDYGRSTTFTDRNGQFSGSAIQSGNTTNFYDRNGRFQGSVTRPPENRR